MSALILPIYYLLVFKSSKERVRKSKEKFNDAFIKDNNILHEGMGQKVLVLFSRSSVFNVIKYRIINLKRELIVGY